MNESNSGALALHRFSDCEAALRNANLKQALYDAGKVVMEGVLLTLHGPEHLKRRGVEARVFRRNFFNHYEKIVFPSTLEQTLAPYLAAGRADLVEFGYRATVNLTADFAGIDRPEKSAEETERLIRLVKKLSEGATMVHSTRDPDELEAEVREALAEFGAAFLQPSIARRQALLDVVAQGTMDAQDLPRDVLTVILQARDELMLDEAQLLREIAFYMQAGAHSTANSVIHAFHEIIQWAGQDAARWARLEQPLFVQRCVHESLRLHPASPEAWRTSMCPMAVPGAGDVEVGRRLVLDLFNANRDRSIFGETADQFDPDRTTPSGVLPTGLAFGIGVHACLGRELDGGLPAKPDTDPETHQYGIVALVVIRLLALGVRPDPNASGRIDTMTIRPNWGSYPVIFARN